MIEKNTITRKELNDEDASKISGGAVIGLSPSAGLAFRVKCSSCGKEISYADHRWGQEKKGTATFVKGYFCNECIEKFRKGEIKDETLLGKFGQLDDRGNPDRYKPIDLLNGQH